jgi:hypothetical protein
MVAPRYWFVCFVLPPRLRPGDPRQWLYHWSERETFVARKKFWSESTDCDPPAAMSLWRWSPVDGWAHLETVSDEGDASEWSELLSCWPSQHLASAMLAAVWNIMSSLDAATYIAPFETIGELGGVS